MGPTFGHDKALLGQWMFYVGVFWGGAFSLNSEIFIEYLLCGAYILVGGL